MSDALDALLAEQLGYYRAAAGEYEQHAIGGWSGGALERVLDRFAPAGSVLELACGTGIWTEQLLRHATAITALDAAPEMLARASARIDDPRVRFIQADAFKWIPTDRYEVVFFAFWLSHVPLERFDSFWALVADCLKPCGRVLFFDDAHRLPSEVVGGERSQTVRRRLSDGSEHDIVKVAHTPATLERRLATLGWRIEVRTLEGPFFCGAGRREAQPSAA